VPWSALVEEVRGLDRVFIGGFPGFRAGAGFQIVRGGEGSATKRRKH